MEFDGNGLKTAKWGPWFWNNFIRISQLPDKEFVCEFFGMMPMMLPCIYCRVSLAEFFNQPENQIQHFRKNEALDKWLCNIYNCVNRKLDKPLKQNHEFLKDYHRPQSWQQAFWVMLFVFAVNFPDWKRIEGDSGIEENDHFRKQTGHNFQKVLSTDVKNMEKRLQTYVRFFRSVPKLLDGQSSNEKKLRQQWLRSLEAHPLTEHVFQSRARLFDWVWRMARQCEWPWSKHETLGYFESWRAGDCSGPSKPGEKVNSCK